MMEPLRNPIVLNSARTRVLELPADLCAQAERKFGQQFKNVSDLLIFVLNELLCERALQLDVREANIVEERLRELGYI
jgi:hypothetical protein